MKYQFEKFSNQAAWSNTLSFYYISTSFYYFFLSDFFYFDPLLFFDLHPKTIARIIITMANTQTIGINIFK